MNYSGAVLSVIEETNKFLNYASSAHPLLKNISTINKELKQELQDKIEYRSSVISDNTRLRDGISLLLALKEKRAEIVDELLKETKNILQNVQTASSLLEQLNTVCQGYTTLEEM